MMPRMLILAALATLARAQAPGNVTLPLDEYNRLIDLANKPLAASANAPVQYAVQSAALELEVKGQTAAGSVQLEGEVFARGPVKMPMTRGMIVVDAQRAGAPLPVQQEGGAQYAILEGPGAFSIVLNAVFSVTVDAGRAGFQLPAPNAGSTRVALTVPGDRTNVTVTPGLITSRANDGAHTRIEATLQPGQLTSLSWTTHDGGAAPAPQAVKEVRFLSDVKTMVTVGESQISLSALADLTVVQGEPAAFEFDIPPGYEIAGATGASLASTETKAGVLTLKVLDAKTRSHQFLITFERAVDDSHADVAIPAFHGSQRETGEAAVEGQGALELSAKETGSLKRMDLKEASPFLIGLAHHPIRAAFRYHRQANEAAAIHLEWQRFPNSAVAAAISDQAIATTLVTADGHTLTEVRLTVRNHAQPFLKVGLPAGATIQTAEVGGQPVKPVVASDGNRIPLLRTPPAPLVAPAILSPVLFEPPGFHPGGPYEVSFVFLSAGAPFAKKGGSALELPKMDLPVAVIHWEVFLPDRYKVKDFAGDVTTDAYVPPIGSPRVPLADYNDLVVTGSTTDALQRAGGPGGASASPLAPGQLAGVVHDPSGAAIANAQVTVTNPTYGQTLRAVANNFGYWKIDGLARGQVRVRVESAGFAAYLQSFTYEPATPRTLAARLSVGSTSETVEARADTVQTETAAVNSKKDRDTPATPDNQASANVLNLQQRVAGVLPIRIDVPRAGHSYRFIRTLVIDEPTKVTFTYKSQ